MRLVPVAKCQRAIPSFNTYFNNAPTPIAQASVVPKRAPATVEETRSAAPTPVAATAKPGPICLTKLQSVCSPSCAVCDAILLKNHDGLVDAEFM